MEPKPATFSADLRRSNRRALEVSIRMTVDSESVTGITDNLSNVGVMFFCQEPLRVTVEFEEDGVKCVRTGKLVRTQKMSERTTGFAVEFDPS